MKKSMAIFTLMVFFFTETILFVSCKKNSSTTPIAMKPSISGFSPASGAVGTKVIITGGNFSTNMPDDIVKFNGVAATVSAASATQLTTTVPASATTGSITVSVNNEVVTSSGFFTILTPPSIASFSPIAGIGYLIVIKGANFGYDSTKVKVTLNGAPAILTTIADAQLTATVPNDASSGKIVVTVNGQSATSATDIEIKKLVATIFAGNGNQGSDDGPGNIATFTNPDAIVADANGNFYVTDTQNDKIRKITSAGVVSTFAGSSRGHVDGSLMTATFSNPAGIAIDKDGNLYISELGYNDIRKITPTGIVSTLAGNVNGFSGSADGTGSTASFNTPFGLAVDANENVYVADFNNNKIRKITPGGVVTTLAGSSVGGSADGLGTAAGFRFPFGIAIDVTGNLYVTDNGNSKIRKITLAGEVTTIAGSGIQGSSDGPGVNASFEIPAGVTVDNSGNLYVTDSYYGRIRFITPGGLVVTLAGNGTMSSVDGTGIFASFYNPFGITKDINGNLYVVDNLSSVIRQILVQ